MTNADKYLKEGISPRELFLDFKRYGCKHNCYLETDEFEEFMREPVKPTLTEDERVILRNIDKKYKFVCRDESTGEIYFKEIIAGGKYIPYYADILTNHLFQFIKERRRI